jgi:hypothetical protein
MKAYITTTGTIFGVIVVAHVWRILEEGTHLATDPAYVALTAAAAGLSLWACRLLLAARGGTAR